MKKIPTMFVRDQEKRALVTPEITPGCEWVANGEGVATRKYDGMSCAILGGKLYKRFEAKDEQLVRKPAPDGAILVDRDMNTAKSIFWVPVGDGPEDKYFRKAIEGREQQPDGTYELLGPKVQGDAEDWDVYDLMPHVKAMVYLDAPRTFEGFFPWFQGRDIEGLVFHHPDGRMAKIKLRDFGLSRKPAKVLA